MDITQTAIKINQTNIVDKGKSKDQSTTDVPVNSFEQILALFNIGSASELTTSLQKSASDTDGNSKNGMQQLPLFSIQNQVMGEGNQTATQTFPVVDINTNQPESLTIDEQDWEQLEAILTALLASIGQLQHSTPASQEGLNVLTENNEEQTVDPSLLSNLNGMKEELTNWLQKRNNQNQPTNDLGDLLQEVSLLINQSSDTENMTGIQKDILDKIQTILGQPKVQDSDTQTINSQLHVNDAKLSNTATKFRLSLDKDQMFTTSTSPVPLNQALQNIPQTDTPEIATPSPVLTVSEFAPEISEWIGRFVKITDGPIGSTEAKFSLYPEHLGHIEVKITSQQGIVTAQILTDTSMAKEALDGQLQQLKQSLQQQGIQLQKIDVIQTQTLTTNQSTLAFAQNGNFSSQREQRNNTPGQEGTKRKKDLDSSEIEMNPVQSAYGGSFQRKDSVLDFTV